VTRNYTPEQINVIRRAIAEAHEVMRQQQRFDALVFARAFVAHGGIQIPGDPENHKACQQVAQALIHQLKTGVSADDPTVQREVHRARTQAHWCAAATSDKIVGFRVTLSPAAQNNPECLALIGMDHGLGSAVIRKGEVLVVPPVCDGYAITPVQEDEVEL